MHYCAHCFGYTPKGADEQRPCLIPGGALQGDGDGQGRRFTHGARSPMQDPGCAQPSGHPNTTVNRSMMKALDGNRHDEEGSENISRNHTLCAFRPTGPVPQSVFRFDVVGTYHMRHVTQGI